MEQNKIKVIIKYASSYGCLCNYEVKEIENNLKSLQEIVKGYIETISIGFGNEKYILICNEEGKYMFNTFSVHFIRNNKIVDSIAGDCIITKPDGKGHFISLSESDIKMISSIFDKSNEIELQ